MLTAGTFLLYETSDGAYTFGQSTTKWGILHTITEYPDLDDEAEWEDNTTLSNAQHTYEPGLPDSGGAKSFSAYFSEAEYNKVKALEDEIVHIGISFGGTTQADNVTIVPTGGKLMADFNAHVRIRLTGAGVGDVRPVTIDLSPTTEAKTYPA